MDRVRLGRALGYGTRHAAKTVAAVVEAAAASDPRAKPNASAKTQSRATAAPTMEAPRLAGPRARVDVGNGVRQFKRSFWQPLAVYSGALWLRVTGLFFALIALTMGSAAWRYRPGLNASAGFGGAHRFWVFAGFAALFGYFAVSSFVRASLKERRAAAGAG